MARVEYDFSEQRILVTAAGDGIGRAIARGFAAAGGVVHAVDVDGGALEALGKEVEGVYATVADVADDAAMEGVFAEQERRFGGIDVLVNCAGIAGPTALLEEISVEDWRRCVAVNLDAIFFCSRRAIPMMRKAGRGNIVNFSSTAGWFGFALRTPYAAAKWGVIGVTKSMAMELGGAGIRVNAICPGSVDGARMDRVIAAEAARKGVDEGQIRADYVRSCSLRAFIQPEEIAQTVLFLASDAARKITGQAVNVDGHMEDFGGMPDA